MLVTSRKWHVLLDIRRERIKTLLFVDIFCHRDSVTTVQDAIMKLYRCVVEINIKVCSRMDVVPAGAAEGEGRK